MINDDCVEFQSFCEREGDDAATNVLELIVDAHCSGGNESVHLTDIETHDPCNHTLTGNLLYAGRLYDFVVENGNFRGTVVHVFDESDDDVPSQLATKFFKEKNKEPAVTAWCW